MLSPHTWAALLQQPELLASLALADLGPAQTLPLLSKLRKTYPPDLAAAALETAQLRHKARAKFERAGQMFFTAEALQQASTEAMARHHAGRFPIGEPVADLGCGIGADSLFLAQRGPLLGLDIDPLRLLLARHNVGVYGSGGDFIQADLTAPLPWGRGGPRYAFFDPARRSGEKRAFSIHDYTPPLSLMHNWPFAGMLVKLSPGVDLAEVRPFGGGIEFISEGGDLKAALLYAGDFAFKGYRATRLPEGESLQALGLEPPPLCQSPMAYIYEPDPAVIRAGLFGELLAHLGLEAFRLDETIAYMTGDRPVSGPWLRSWRLHNWLPFNLKKLRQVLVGYGVGAVTVKKRGSPILPEELQKMLKLKGGGPSATVFLTRLHGKPVALISLDQEA